MLNVLVKQNFQDEDLQKDVEFLQEYLTDSVNDMRYGRECNCLIMTNMYPLICQSIFPMI